VSALVFIDGNELRAAELRQILAGAGLAIELSIEALQTGFSTSAPEPSQRARDKVLAHTATEGGGSIALSVGPSYRLDRAKRAYASTTSWTRLSVQDTVSLAPGDTVWVALSSFNTDLASAEASLAVIVGRSCLTS